MEMTLTRESILHVDFQMISKNKLSEKSLSPFVFCEHFSTFTCLFFKWVNFIFTNPIPLTTPNRTIVQFQNRHRTVSYIKGKK